MKILVTGIQGYLGRGLAKQLSQDHEVYGLDNDLTPQDKVVEIFPIAAINKVPDVDLVLHAAGRAMDTNDDSLALAYFEENAGLTHHVFEWFKNSAARSFIFFSSVKAVADTLPNQVLTEDEEPKPFGPLGESKLLAERYILNQYVFDKKVYVLRTAILHGCGMMGNYNLEKMYNYARKGCVYPFGKFERKRSYTSMENLAFVLHRMLEMDIPTGIYNVADDDTLTLRETYEVVCAGLGKRTRLVDVPKWIIHLVFLIGSGWHHYFNLYQWEKMNTNFIVSNEKIKKALNIDKMPVSPVDGLMNTVQCFAGKKG